MHKRENLAKQTAREESKIGWTAPLRERKHDLLGEINQPHMSLGKGFRFARSLGGRNLALNKHREGRG
jgi:hypothetical protein